MQKDYTSYALVYLWIFVYYIHILIYSPYVESTFFPVLELKAICHNFASLILLKAQGLAKIFKELFEKHVTRQLSRVFLEYVWQGQNYA